MKWHPQLSYAQIPTAPAQNPAGGGSGSHGFQCPGLPLPGVASRSRALPCRVRSHPGYDSPEQRVRSERLRQVRDRTQSQGKRSCEMSEQPSQPSVFLSYAARDKAAAETVSNAMRQGGLDVRTADGSWAGRDLAETIATAMRECDAFVLVATPERVNSTWAPFEFGAARALGMPIFVVLTEQGPLPGYLRDFSTGSVKDVDRLVRAIRAATEPLSDPERDILTD